MTKAKDSAPRTGPQEPRQEALVLESNSPGTHRVAGAVERITYHHEDTGFSVLRVRTDDGRESFTVVGKTAHVAKGEWVEAVGVWRSDPKHGRQFKAEELRVTTPTTRDGIESFLGSGAVHGVGPALAKRLLDRFGESVFDVIENSPERLREIEGVGKVRGARIASAWEDQHRVREVMLFLYSHGIGTNRALRIYKTYGAKTLETVRRDPYQLTQDVRGIGFATADALAKQLGFEQTAPSRLRAGVREVLRSALKQGHCGLPYDRMLEDARRLLGTPEHNVAEAAGDLVVSRELTEDVAAGQSCLFLANLHRAEEQASMRLLSLAKGALPWKEIDAEAAIQWAQGELKIEFAPLQREAIAQALRSKLMVLTGGPGVGKTTLVRAILLILARKRLKIRLAAPTGRAAKRLADTTEMEAKTIHRLLEAQGGGGGFKRNAEHPLDCDLLVVDETSMVDVNLLDSLTRALRPTSAVLFIGDVDQLPSVGPGQVLRDMIDSEAVPVVRLDTVFRQAATSQIITSAHAVNAGQLPSTESVEGSDFYFIETRDSEDTERRLLSVVSERIPARFGLDPMRDVQVLSPMHRGRVGTQNLNARLQSLLKRPHSAEESIERDGATLGPGDKIMQVSNNYDKDVYNGDIGWVSSIDREAQTLIASFDGRTIRYEFDELDQVNLAYAITIHKSQGSEYPAAVIPVVTDHFVMLKRNLLYTAMTRGKQLVVLLGQRRALEIAVRSIADQRRTTKLQEWLRAARS